MSRLAIVPLALALAAGLAAAQEAPAPPTPPAPPAVEVVQTVPVETDLAQPDLRHAKDVWLEMVKGAKATIDIAQFYVANEPKGVLEPVMAEIERAAERGVRVRLLISDKMLKNDRPTLERFRKLKGGKVHLGIDKLTDGILHAKYWIVDGETVFVGSQNFDWRALGIHETGVLVRDRAIAEKLARIFETDVGISETGKAPAFGSSPAAPAATTGSANLELVASPPALNPPGVRPALDALLALLNGARKRIRIQLLDYTPVGFDRAFWPDLDNALRAAAVRGVKVEMLLSHWNTARPGIDHLKSLSLVPNVTIKIVTIPEAAAGFIPYARVIHSKYMVVDDSIFWIGTSNWSKGYFMGSRNVELVIRKPEIAAQGNRIFEKLWAEKYSVAVDVGRDYPKPRKGD